MLRDDAAEYLEMVGPEEHRSLSEQVGARLATAILDADVVAQGGCPFCGSPVADKTTNVVAYWCNTATVGKHTIQRDDCKDICINRLTASLAVDRERLARQSAELNAVRQQRDELQRAYEDCFQLERKAGGE